MAFRSANLPFLFCCYGGQNDTRGTPTFTTAVFLSTTTPIDTYVRARTRTRTRTIIEQNQFRLLRNFARPLPKNNVLLDEANRKAGEKKITRRTKITLLTDRREGKQQ